MLGWARANKFKLLFGFGGYRLLANQYENFVLHDCDQFMFGDPPAHISLVAQVTVAYPLVPRAEVTRVVYCRPQCQRQTTTYTLERGGCKQQLTTTNGQPITEFFGQPVDQLPDLQVYRHIDSQWSDAECAKMDANALQDALVNQDCSEVVWFPPRLLPGSYVYSETAGSRSTQYSSGMSSTKSGGDSRGGD